MFEWYDFHDSAAVAIVEDPCVLQESSNINNNILHCAEDDWTDSAVLYDDTLMASVDIPSPSAAQFDETSNRPDGIVPPPPSLATHTPLLSTLDASVHSLSIEDMLHLASYMDRMQIKQLHATVAEVQRDEELAAIAAAGVQAVGPLIRQAGEDARQRQLERQHEEERKEQEKHAGRRNAETFHKKRIERGERAARFENRVAKLMAAHTNFL